MDARVANGPLEQRSCTDVLFCLLFLAFVVGLGVISVFGYNHGQPERLLAPLDADGKFCGIEQGYEAYKYLYIMDVSQSDILSTAVCVSSCPSKESQVDCKPTSVVKACNDVPQQYRYDTNLLFKKACLPDFDSIPAEFKDKYDNIVGGLGIDDVGQAIDDILNTWQIYCIAFASTFIIT